MSPPFGTVMRDLNHLLQTTYQCASVALIPGSGTYGMEAVGRQFATDEHVLILRNGWFRYVLLVYIYYSSWNKNKKTHIHSDEYQGPTMVFSLQ